MKHKNILKFIEVHQNSFGEWNAKLKTQRVEFMTAKYNRMVKRHANNE